MTDKLVVQRPIDNIGIYNPQPAPAPLDVEALAKAMQSYYRRPPGWQTDPLPVDQRRAADTFAGHAEAIAAIYARLTATPAPASPDVEEDHEGFSPTQPGNTHWKRTPLARAAATENTDAQ